MIPTVILQSVYLQTITAYARAKNVQDKFFLEPQSNLFLGCGHTNLISRALRKTGEQKE